MKAPPQLLCHVRDLFAKVIAPRALRLLFCKVQRPRTMLYGARRRVWPGIPSSSRCTRKNSGARCLTDSSRSSRRRGTSGAPWNRLLDTALIVPVDLMFLCRRWRYQLVEVCRQLDVRIHAQDLISIPSLPAPCALRAEQTAEQLVEVPTILSYSSLLQRTVEQNVDIPVLGRGGRNVGLQGFSSQTAFNSAACFSETQFRADCGADR